MNSQKKILMVINVDNVIDIITNSSSELFVLNGETKEIVSEMIMDIYPDYLSEYEEVVSLKDASNMQLETYRSWVVDRWYDSYGNGYYNMTEDEKKAKEINNYVLVAKKYDMDVIDFYDNWLKYKNGKQWKPDISDVGYDAIRAKLDPNGNIFLLFSIHDNPKQENLEQIATRYHLG